MANEKVTKRIRGRPLTRIRNAHFKANPLCVRCKAAGRYRLATQLDHKIPLFKGGKEEESNRQGLCDDCHEKKTAEDMNYKVRPKIGLDGYPIETETK